MQYRYEPRALTATCLCACLLLWGTLPAYAAAATPPGSIDIPAILKQAREYQFRFRDGELDVAPDNVALLEKATAAEPGNADLWQALGLAYVTFAARATMSGGDRSEALIAMQKGMPALNRALQIDPDHAEALSLRAGMRAMMGVQMNQPQMLRQAIADMNRAIELAPGSAAARLIRAFGAPTMPEDLRNKTNEASDLEFLMEYSDRNRAGDFITILRADLHFENGEATAARQLYNLVEDSGAASAAQMAKSRLALLPQGRDAVMKDIKALRTVVGTQCSMCHGR